MDVGVGREGLRGGGDTAPAGPQQVSENRRHRRTQMMTELRIETVLAAVCKAGSLELPHFIGFLWG